MRSSQKVSGPTKMLDAWSCSRLQILRFIGLKTCQELRNLCSQRGLQVSLVFLSSPFGNFITDQKSTRSGKPTWIENILHIRSPHQYFNHVRACAIPFPCTRRSAAKAIQLALTWFKPATDMLPSVKELRTWSGDQVSRTYRLQSGADIAQWLSETEITGTLIENKTSYIYTRLAFC